VPRNVFRDKIVEVRTFVEQLKEVIVNGPERIVQVNSIKQEAVPVTEQIVKYLNQEVEREFSLKCLSKKRKLNCRGSRQNSYCHETQEIRLTNTEPVYSEKILERLSFSHRFLKF
jgi:hypothetical protein